MKVKRLHTAVRCSASGVTAIFSSFTVTPGRSAGAKPESIFRRISCGETDSGFRLRQPRSDGIDDCRYFRFCVIVFCVSEIFFSTFDSVDDIFDMRSIAI